MFQVIWSTINNTVKKRNSQEENHQRRHHRTSHDIINLNCILYPSRAPSDAWSSHLSSYHSFLNGWDSDIAYVNIDLWQVLNVLPSAGGVHSSLRLQYKPVPRFGWWTHFPKVFVNNCSLFAVFYLLEQPIRSSLIDLHLMAWISVSLNSWLELNEVYKSSNDAVGTPCWI